MATTFTHRLNFAYERERERRLLAGEPRLTKTEIWKAAGTTSGAATHWFNGSNGMDLNTCFLVAPVLRVNPHWLYDESRAIDDIEREEIHRKGDNIQLLSYSNVVKNKSESYSELEPGPTVKGRTPLISWVSAGLWDESMDIYEPGFAEEWVDVYRATTANTFALRVSGDSMTATHGKSYPNGSIIIVDPEKRNPNNGDRIIAKLKGSNEVTFKVFVREEGRVWLKPLNHQYPPILEEFSVIGKVVSKWEPED